MITIPPNGLFISFEGLDGSGKRTQVHLLRDFLEQATNKTVSFHSEPNDNSLCDSPIGKHIRKVLKGEISRPEDMMDFQRLYVIDRAQNFIVYILPWLKRGEIWIADRSIHSALAYGMLKGPVETFINLHYDVIGKNFLRWPDVAYFIDIPAEEAIRRVDHRGEGLEYFDKLPTLKAVRDNYFQLTKRNDVGTIVVIDGTGTREDIFESIKKDLLRRFWRDDTE